MASPTARRSCIKCHDGLGNTTCAGCQQWFCTRHFNVHREELAREMYNVGEEHDVLQRDLTEEKSEHLFLFRINDWEQKSIDKIRKAAQEARMDLKKHLHNTKNQLKMTLDQLAQEFQSSREADDYTEIELKIWVEQLEELRWKLEKLSTVKIIDDDDETPAMIRLIHLKEHHTTIRPHITVNARWTPNGITVAGGHRAGNGLNQLCAPVGLYVDDEQTVFIADYSNHRIVEWTCDGTIGQVVAGGNEQGNRLDQLSTPAHVIVDKETNSLIISDCGNRRVMRWSRRSRTSGEVIISNVLSYRLAMDDERSLYVCDWENHEVRQYREGETDWTVVAGGSGPGNHLSQLNGPVNVFVDRDHSVYVSDYYNHRVMKWVKDATEGIVVAGGQGKGNSLTQLNSPRGLVVDPLGIVYVGDYGNHRVMRWCNGATEGSIIVGRNGIGTQANQLNCPSGLSFDRQNNLYVADRNNHRIQRFDIEWN